MEEGKHLHERICATRGSISCPLVYKASTLSPVTAKLEMYKSQAKTWYFVPLKALVANEQYLPSAYLPFSQKSKLCLLLNSIHDDTALLQLPINRSVSICFI